MRCPNMTCLHGMGKKGVSNIALGGGALEDMRLGV